ncbi:uncharacterized protein LOC122318560 isoform X1 [Carya illinoinensis]|uniref:FHA domain-containing protein n=1 Tax=Carya illinoinensis TaxID=32201 RepID=A0A8T1PW79_CARIL|nr:uncharacterized protein LOC122318560 isoform X1 [Carya illinoinensis]KAG6644560.1 hypothetical protein CIPAW_08G062300 [Carya illinoinensis]
MGSLAPVSYWNPEDDLLLMNAVEAGASLESLAKGAVQFSKRFTVREVQDRWHSLLYDPVISTEASARMIAFDRSATIPMSKFSRSSNSKEIKPIYGKRKAGSVRNCYYALRKRICNVPFNSMNMNFLDAPDNGNFIGNGDEPLSGDPISDNFGLQGSNLDAVFPQNQINSSIATDGTAAAAHSFQPGLQHPGDKDYLIGKANIYEDTRTFGANLHFSRNSSGVEELGRPKQVMAHNLFKSDDLCVEPSSTFDQIDNDPGNICSDFEGNQVFNSLMSECGASFHNLGFSSPVHGMPIWRTVEGIVDPSMAVDVGLREKDIYSGVRFELPNDDDARNATTLGYDGQLDFKLKIETPCDGLKSPTASTEGYLEELSNSLLNFTNEEDLLFMDVYGKDVIDKSYYDGLSSLLLNSPNDASQNHTPCMTEPQASVSQETYLNNPSNACPGELENNKGSLCGDGQGVQDSGTQILSSSLNSNSQFPELSEEFMFCTLNTEDPEIPCNDDFCPQNWLSSSSVSFIANNPTHSTVNDILSSQRTRERGLLPMQREGEKMGEFRSSSASLSIDACRPTMLKEENVEVSPSQLLGHNQMNSFIKRPSLCSDSVKACTQANANSIKWELDVPAPIGDYQSTHSEIVPLDISVPEPVENPLISEQEELPVESDDDVPHYSDMEAMILDMDLEPEDQDLYSSEEVSRYRLVDTKRAIIRLEQGAHCSMQRAIASHGAFAILYGRYSKHYIKKPEVLLGRATEDVIVDIDLGREGRANKISRRQAIIKMDNGGSFYLTNLGKCSISVNNKEVGPGQSLSLICSCLIEIRGMPFIFEMNGTRVQQYLCEITKNNQT